MAFASYFKMKDKTPEEVQQEIDGLTHSEFMLRLASLLGAIGTHGASAHYFGGTITPMAMLVRAMCNRVARINGNVELMKDYLHEFSERDAKMKKEGEAASSALSKADLVQKLWIDHEAFTKAVTEMSTAQALVTAYPLIGCIPLRTLTPEELQDNANLEL